VVLCGHCHSVHHLDCWEDNGGCAVVACAGGPAKAAKVAAAEQAFPPTISQPIRTVSVPVVEPPPPPGVPPAGRSGASRGLIAAVVVLAVAVAGVGAALLLTRGKNPTPARAAAVVHHHTGHHSASSIATVTETVTSSTSTQSTPATQNTQATHSTSSTTSTRNTTSTPTAPTSTTSTHVVADSETASGGGSAAKAALDSYWSQVNSGDYQDAYNDETPAEQHGDSITNMEQDQARIHVMWTTPGVPNSSGESSRISFYTVDTDGVCRHFSIDSQMVWSGSQWLYDGPVSGSSLVDDTADGNPNCPG
jgi:hypothetical protein